LRGELSDTKEVMGKAARSKRSKRKRRSVQSARRTTGTRWWYGLVAVILVAGIALVAFSRTQASSAVGPQPGRDHWHAALGVYDCNRWLGDSTGSGLWLWPAATDQGSPARVGTNQYAGLHSHDDGIIHMEPVSADESGNNATVGRYFEFGGWKLSATSYSFLGNTVQNGNRCGNQSGVIRWETARFNGNINSSQPYVEHTGNPADFKLNNGDIVVIAFVPRSASLAALGNPPSLPNLPNALGREGQGTGTTMPTVPTT
jgi:hypothetical protein